MRRRGLPVLAPCCALLMMFAAATGTGMTSRIQRRVLNENFRGPDECNPIRGHSLPEHCFSENTNPSVPRPSTYMARNTREVNDGSYRGPPECNPTQGRDLPDHCKSESPRSSTARPWRPRQRVVPSNADRPVKPEGPAPADAESRLDRASTPAPADEEDDDVYVPFAGHRLDVFDWRLVRELDRFAMRRNAVVSPVGVKLVLGLLHEAASRASAVELRRALGLSASSRNVRDAFRLILSTLQEKQQGYVMKVANRVFLDQSYQPRTNIANIYKSYYSTEIESIDFRSPAIVKPMINSWVSNFTNGMIKNLITNDKQVQNLLTMVLNVIYFKGDWLHPFTKESTSKGSFYVDSENNVTVDYMHMTRDLYYSESEELDAKILRLPYEGKKYSMFFILPKKKGNFNQMVQLVTPALVREQLHSLKKVEVKVKLPKFKFQYTVHLKELLQKLGITRIFTQSDEINLTVNKTNLMISKVIQKVGLEVNEHGTEVTSVTEIDIVNHFGGSRTFMATHPFLFFVEEEKTGTIVFIGKVIDPSYVKPVQPTTSPVEVNVSGILEKDFSEDISQQTPDKHTPPVSPLQTK